MKKLLNLFVVALAIGALFIGCKKDADDDDIDVPTTTHYDKPASANETSDLTSLNENFSSGAWTLKMGFTTDTNSAQMGEIGMAGNTTEEFTVDNNGIITYTKVTIYTKETIPGWGTVMAQLGGVDSSVQTDPTSGLKMKQSISGEDLIIEMWGKIPQDEIDAQNATNPTLTDLFEGIDNTATIYTNSDKSLYYISYSGTKESESEDEFTGDTITVAIDVTYTAILKKK